MKNFITFLLILFVLATLLRIDFFFSILYLFVGVYLLSHFWSQHIIKRLHLSRTLPSRAFLGDQISVTLTVENRGYLPVPWLLLKETLPIALVSPPFWQEVITLDGKATYNRHYTVIARQRGYHPIGPLTLQSGDLLGLKHDLNASFGPDYLIVYPKIVPIAHLNLPTHSPHVVLPTPVPLFQDPARITGVRAYHPCDNPRHIHWTASAASNQLLVKQFQPAIARDSAIFLNLDRADYASRGYPNLAIELAVTVAASLANHILSFEKLPVGLIATANDPLTESRQNFRLLPRPGRDQLLQILEILARVQATQETYFLARVRQEMVYLSWGTTVILITSAESAELLETLLLLKRSGFRPALVLIQPPSRRQAGETEQTRGLGIPVFRIRREREIEAWVRDS